MIVLVHGWEDGNVITCVFFFKGGRRRREGGDFSRFGSFHVEMKDEGDVRND